MDSREVCVIKASRQPESGDVFRFVFCSDYRNQLRQGQLKGFGFILHDGLDFNGPTPGVVPCRVDMGVPDCLPLASINTL